MERDVRIDIIQSILNTPHKNIDPLVPVHESAENADPLFYAKMAIWYKQNGNIRDHNKLFAARTVTSQFEEFRDLGVYLMQSMPVREVKNTVEVAFDKFNGGTSARRRRIRGAVETALRIMERGVKKDGGSRLVRNRKVARNLYSRLHIAPGSPEIAASLRFEAGGATPLPAVNAMRKMGRGELNEREVCEAIAKYKLPPMQVMGSLDEVTPAIAAAMLGGMSPTETVNYMQTFERKGLLDIPEFRKAVNTKLKKNKGKSASLRTKKAAKSMKKHSDVMDTATDNFVDSLPTIKQSVLLAVDKSFSMAQAIELGKEAATILAAKVENPDENLHIVVFDNTVKEVPKSTTGKFTDFEARFRYIRANGTTSLGAIIEYIDNNDLHPDAVLMITDAEETDVPFLENALAASSNIAGVRIINCKVGTNCYDLNVSDEVKQGKALEIENVKYDGDYYSLPNIVKLVAAGGIRELIKTIDAIDINSYIKA